MTRDSILACVAVLALILATALGQSFSQEAIPRGDVLAKSRSGRLFSLFNIVTFKNLQCTGSSSTTSNMVKGTCMSSTECASKSNSVADGHCASGFGVCCVITISGCSNTVSENCTYVQNDGYPSVITATSSSCITTITRPSNPKLCQIRLDFEKFTSLLNAATAGECSDTFTVTAPFSSSANAFPPTVCGILDGQHMYYETGETGNPSFTFATATASGDRTYRIKVTMIECSSSMRAPANCVQYFTGLTGIMETYNFDGSQMLTSQDYSSCIRQERGYCSILMAENPGVTDGFQLGAITTQSETTAGSCGDAYITWNTGNEPPTFNYLCGAYFSNDDTQAVSEAVPLTIPPFLIRVKSDNAAQTSGTGYSLIYTQVPC